jgi:membrane associated rhomboid family serine protease
MVFKMFIPWFLYGGYCILQRKLTVIKPSAAATGPDLISIASGQRFGVLATICFFYQGLHLLLLTLPQE